MEDGVLRRLETGPEVGELQEKLRTLDIRDDRNRVLVVNDRFGGPTEQAVRRFQEQNDLAITGRADPATLQAVELTIERQRQQNEPVPPPARATGDARQTPTGGALQLDDPRHPNHGMYAKLLATVSERDAALGRPSDRLSAQLSGGLTADARERGLEQIGYAQFSADGSRVYMADSQAPSAPWARKAVGDVGQALQRTLSESSEQVAELNRGQARQASAAVSNPHQDGPSPGPRSV